MGSATHLCLRRYPNQVTVYGESAGGQSIAVQVASPLSVGLFHRAITESAPVGSMTTLSQRMSDTMAVAAYVGCSTIECLKSYPNVSHIFSAILDLKQDWTTATVDGTANNAVLPMNPVDMARAGRFNKVPMQIGSNSLEGSFFLPGVPAKGQAAATLSFSEAQCVMRHILDDPTKASELQGVYPILDGADNRDIVAQLFSDAGFHCPNNDFAAALATSGASVWMFSFQRSPGCPFEPLPGPAHTFEIPYVFQDNLTMYCTPPAEAPAEDVALSRQMGDLWGFFAREGRQVPSWPRFPSVAKLDIGLDGSAVASETGYRRGQCAKLAELGVGPKQTLGNMVLHDENDVTWRPVALCT